MRCQYPRTNAECWDYSFELLSIDLRYFESDKYIIVNSNPVWIQREKRSTEGCIDFHKARNTILNKINIIVNSNQVWIQREKRSTEECIDFHKARNTILRYTRSGY